MTKVKILVPTDFSECARNALNYAIGLANDIHSELIILHSIIYESTPLVITKTSEEKDTETFNRAKDQLDAEFNYIKSKGISAKEILDGGTPELSITSVIETEKIDYVVMGTEGATGLKTAVFGSFTSNVILVSSCPVFTIPLTGKYKGIKNIVCATEMDNSEIGPIKHLIYLAKQFNAQITFYNVNPHEEEQRVDSYKFERFIKKLTDYPSIDYVLIDSKDILGSMDGYVCDNNPDLVVTFVKEKNLFEKLFGKKVTKALCLHSTVPLLSFPAAYTHKEKSYSVMI